jgi:hypothetical protein
MSAMGVKDFDTKVAVVVRDDLETWQRLNVTAFLMSGIAAAAGPDAIGEPYRDADDREYLPLLVQPVLVLAADLGKLRALRDRAERRAVPVAIYTADMFATGHDTDNRAAVRAVGDGRPRPRRDRAAPRTATPTRCSAASGVIPEPVAAGAEATEAEGRRR